MDAWGQGRLRALGAHQREWQAVGPQRALTRLCRYLQSARGSVAREAAALEEQRAALASLLSQLEQREDALGQVCGGGAGCCKHAGCRVQGF
jgi:hypothetical protein